MLEELGFVFFNRKSSLEVQSSPDKKVKQGTVGVVKNILMFFLLPSL